MTRQTTHYLWLLFIGASSSVPSATVARKELDIPRAGPIMGTRKEIEVHNRGFAQSKRVSKNSDMVLKPNRVGVNLLVRSEEPADGDADGAATGTSGNGNGDSVGDGDAAAPATIDESEDRAAGSGDGAATPASGDGDGDSIVDSDAAVPAAGVANGDGDVDGSEDDNGGAATPASGNGDGDFAGDGDDFPDDNGDAAASRDADKAGIPVSRNGNEDSAGSGDAATPVPGDENSDGDADGNGDARAAGGGDGTGDGDGAEEENTAREVLDFGNGLKFTVIKAGDRKTFPKDGEQLAMHYTLTLADDSSGKAIDSSRARDEPLTFTIGRGEVIKGWDQGIMKMSLGQRGILTVPSALGYGARGSGPNIPPNADLSFDVELLKIVDAPADIFVIVVVLVLLVLIAACAAWVACAGGMWQTQNLEQRTASSNEAVSPRPDQPATH